MLLRCPHFSGSLDETLEEYECIILDDSKEDRMNYCELLGFQKAIIVTRRSFRLPRSPRVWREEEPG